MTKRKFSAERLYKLVRLIVIIISVLSGISAFLQYRLLAEYKSEFTELVKNNDLLRDEVEITEKEYNELFMLELQRKTTDKVKRQIEKLRKLISNKERIAFLIGCQGEVEKRIFRCSIVAIGLPILFFGGVGIYRYLFPILGFDQKKAKE
jgi:hypothetical protein